MNDRFKIGGTNTRDYAGIVYSYAVVAGAGMRIVFKGCSPYLVVRNLNFGYQVRTPCFIRIPGTVQ